MTFNSIQFLIFYPIVALLYFLLPKRLRWIMLLAASYYFYAFYQAELLFLIIGTTAVSWCMAFAIERTQKRWKRRLCLSLTLVVCLGVLFFYKYANFFVGSAVGIINLLGGHAPEIIINAVLPVGISFYTFQTLSYVIDVYRGNVVTERNPFFYALYVSFFPQLVAGPIERPGNLIPQLKEEHRFNKEDAVKGAKHMLLGFFKKICVADCIAVYVNSVYNNPAEATGFGVLLATVLFAVQIYCDFSGYTDIAIGCARVMGIRLMKNFDHPYTATSIKEFWGRWHISLSSWFRDYLYIPLGGSRCSLPRCCLNLMMVFAVSGLWHGAEWTFVIWGLLHGAYQVIGRLTAKKRNSLVIKAGFSPTHPAVLWTRRIITFILVDFAWLVFRANSVSDVGLLLEKLLFGWQGLEAGFEAAGIGVFAVICWVLSIAVLWFMDRLLTHEGSSDGSDILVRRGAFIYIIWAVILCWVFLLSENIQSGFIYFQF